MIFAVDGVSEVLFDVFYDQRVDFKRRQLS